MACVKYDALAIDTTAEHIRLLSGQAARAVRKIVVSLSLQTAVEQHGACSITRCAAL